ncbi:MAG: hypothetical protein H6Q72_961 [Firmicutes bacterium]|nr:hypothetical protein [Bacillota bacterium]
MTKYDICNIALSNLGITRSISNFTDNTIEAMLCGRYYDLAKEIALTAYEWKFANIYNSAALTLTEDAHAEYQYVYEYPDDCLKITAVGTARDLGVFEYPFEVFAIYDENYDTVKRIGCDIADATASYLVDVDENAMPAAFVKALSWGIAAEVAYGLTTSPQMAQYASQMYGVALNQAIHRNFTEGKQTKEMPRYIRARGGWYHGKD